MGIHGAPPDVSKTYCATEEKAPLVQVSSAVVVMLYHTTGKTITETQCDIRRTPGDNAGDCVGLRII